MAATPGRRRSDDDADDHDRARRWWSEEETLDLLQLIAREKVVAVLDGKRQRNAHVFRRLAALMDKVGYPRTPEQIRSRWKFLKSTYVCDTRKHFSVNGARNFNNKYFSVMAGLMKQLAAKELSYSCSKPTMRTRRHNGNVNSTEDTPGIRMEVYIEADEDGEEVEDDVQDEAGTSSAAAPAVPAASVGRGPVGRKAASAQADEIVANCTADFEKIMDTGVDCILDEASGTESSELRSMLIQHVSEEQLAPIKRPTSIAKQGINIRPRTLTQYTRKDKVADKLIGIMMKQTRLMEEEHQWRRDYVVQQQRWEEQMLSTQMKQLETMMVNVTKMILPAMNGRNLPEVSTSTGTSSSTASSSWPQPQPPPAPQPNTWNVTNGSQQPM